MGRLKGRVATVVVAALAAIGLVFTGIAIAGFTAPAIKTGGPLLQTKVATQSGNYTIPDSAEGWTNVPTAELEVTLPSGKKRLVIATFNAETMCSSVGKSYCRLRIMAQKGGGSPQQLLPKVGNEFAMDTGADSWSAHTAIRMAKLSPGKWTFYVQGNVLGVGNFWIDDWLFKVDVHK